MKKILSTVLLSIIFIISIIIPTQADSETSQLRLKVNNSNENYSIYILLPKKYVKYVIQYDGLDINYSGADTLKNNVIPNIIVDINKIEDETYIDNGIEYIQIKLDDLGEEEYVFDILSEYKDMDMLYRVKSSTRDNIMIIDNFRIENNTCKMVYDYETNTIKTNEQTHFKLGFDLSWWQVALIIILVVFGLGYIYDRRGR